jgi:hypothetical protein
VKKLQDSGAECSEMSKKNFTVKSGMVSLASVVRERFMKADASEFQNFCVNFHKFHALFPMRLSQIG